MGQESEWSRSDEKCLGLHFESEESRAATESRESHYLLQFENEKVLTIVGTFLDFYKWQLIYF